LTRPFDQHLDNAELNKLVELGRAGVSEPISDPNLGEAQRHVESCQDCSRTLQRHQFVHGEILCMRAPNPSRPAPQCIADAGWLEVAAGLLPEAKTRELMKHAAQCGHCGPLLRNAAEIIAEEATQSEETLLESLKSAQPEWRKKMAVTLRDSVRDRRRTPSWWPTLLMWPTPAYVCAMITLVATVAWIGWRTLRSPSPEQLLAQAYSEHRIIEVRIPGARYAPLRVERSAVGSSLEKSPALLKAETLIAENLQKNPNNPRWLQAKARADMLDGNYDSAIQSLQRALETDPDSFQLLADLGSAFFVRGEASDRPIDYRDANQYLSAALTRSPNDPIVLFNRAIAAEKMFLYDQAVGDWNHYLRMEPRGKWAEEGRIRLAALTQKLNQRKQSAIEPLLGPEAFIRVMASPAVDAKVREDQRIEEYLDHAIQHWLPDAYPENREDSKKQSNSSALGATAVLAGVLVNRHRDVWLKDLLRASASSDFPTGIRYLASAARANAQGDPDVALSAARLARHWFHNANSTAGELRSEVEEIYALHRKYQGEKCMIGISKLEKALRQESYPWIRIQVTLEHYACLSPKETRPDLVSRLLMAAREEARRSEYGTIYLRALAFSASSENEFGSTDKEWEWDWTGLEKYWSGQYPPLRAQHFYDDLSISAQDSSKWLLAVALGKEAVSAISASPNRTGEGLERMRLADSAIQAGLWQEASQQYAGALSAFSSLPRDNSNRAFRASAETGLAEVSLAQGRINDAEEHLHYAQGNLPSDFEEPKTWLAMYRTLAELRRQIGDSDGAQKACVGAILVAETDLLSVHTELDKLRWSRGGADKCYKMLVRSKITSRDDASALELWEWFQSAGAREPRFQALPHSGFADLDRSPVLSSVNEVGSHLPSLREESVIIYADLGDNISAWLYDNRGIYRQRLAVSPAELNNIATKFAADCADPESDSEVLRVSGRKLYDFLIAPFVSHLDPARTLVIESSDELAEIPFAALIAPNGDYLVDHFPIVYLPNIGFRRFLRASTPVGREDVALVVGAPAIGRQNQMFYPPLEDADAEAQEVSGEFSHALLLTGMHATSAALTGSLHRASIFHFAGHTWSSPGHSALLLAPNLDSTGEKSTTFGYDQIVSTSMPHLTLAVLSACSTGRDGSDGANPGDNLARAFLRSGVPNVIATRWRVDSAATAKFMSLFYERSLNGSQPAAAVAASMKRLRELPGYSHPYYWATFDIYGRAFYTGAQTPSSVG
jgi:CHAT domain-containing protein/tetratricopeptide (TPR) repeat protein